MNRLFYILALAAVSCFGQSYTTINGSVASPTTGSPINGTATITLTKGITSQGVYVPAIPVTATITSGAFTVALVANDTASPVDAYYNVSYSVTSGGAMPADTWWVRTSNTALGIADVSVPKSVFYGVLLPPYQISVRGSQPGWGICNVSGVATWSASCGFSGSGYATVMNGGSALTQRSILNASTGLTATDNPGTSSTNISVNYGTASGTAAQGNDSRIVGAEQAANKDTTSGYAGLAGGLLKLAEFPSPFNAFQGNGSKVQLSAGTITPGDCAQFDTNGNTVDAGQPCPVTGGVSSVGASSPLASTGGASPTISISANPGFTTVSTGTSPPASAWFTGTAGSDIFGDGTCTGTVPSATSALADCAGVPTWMTASGNAQLLQGSTGPVNVSALPACSSTTEGQRAAVNNSNASSFTSGIGAVAAGGGSTHAPVYCDGTNWRIG